MTEPWHATLSWDNQAKVWYVSETNFPGRAGAAHQNRAPRTGTFRAEPLSS